MKKLFITSLVCNLFLLLQSSIFALPRPYCNVTTILPLDLHGWFANENQQNLKKFLNTKNVKTVEENLPDIILK